MNKIYVIGIGYKPLDKWARDIILNSSVILASKRLFEVFKGYDEFEAVKDKVKIINNVDETIAFIRAEALKSERAEASDFRISELPNFRTIVLLASGDPTFFGIGRRAVREFGKDAVEIIPDLSCIQIAFSRVKESWDDAFLMSLHGGPDPKKRRRLSYEINDIPSLLQRHNKIAILTDKENNPSEIAKELLKPSAISHQPSKGTVPDLRTKQSGVVESGLSPSAIKIYVCEKLGYKDERITEGTPDEISAMTFGEPNVVIIRGTEGLGLRNGVTFGLKEDEITHSRGLITKDEVRAVTIHKLRLPQKGVFWDIGAGSGSVSVEAAKLCPKLKVFSIERDKEQRDNIGKNKLNFHIQNIEIIKGEAPEALKNLPLPDRVFIGGSGDRLKEIMDYVIKAQVNLIVVNAATIETMNDAVQCFEEHGFDIAISEISVSRAKTIAGKRHMSALNPIFVIAGEK